jgi:hypothetical protein
MLSSILEDCLPLREREVRSEHNTNVVAFATDFRDSRAAKNAFLANPNVLSMTMADPPPEGTARALSRLLGGKNQADESLFFPLTVDEDYLKKFRAGVLIPGPRSAL